MTKWSVQKQTHRTTKKHIEHQDATDIQKKPYFCDFVLFSFIYNYNFLSDFSKKSCITALLR